MQIDHNINIKHLQIGIQKLLHLLSIMGVMLHIGTPLYIDLIVLKCSMVKVIPPIMQVYS